MAVHRQKVIFTSTRDYELHEKELRIPKVINTDIGFELMFGFEPDDIGTDNRIYDREYRFYDKHTASGQRKTHSESDASNIY